ncbi:MAG TPA: glutamine--fructose-6-phosphate transaminase (isomerizing) [Candidatus Paceibacterota bacterium]|jgi:glucosamine--fructose-6-phosphate aminotransferase (isomerizing)
MCGIIGYIGKKNAVPIIIAGLKSLEYRGYDSAGLYTAPGGAVKAKGRVRSLEEKIPPGLSAHAGIGHTRWATHGPPTEENAHPHADATGTIWVVHNGIIENFRELRTELEAEGVAFRSETDTEALAQLIGKYYAESRVLETAVASALSKVRGAYGIAVMSTEEPDKIVAARLGSPLLIGITEEGYALASDPAPLLPQTRDVVYLDDGEMAVLTRDRFEITGVNGLPVQKTPETIDWDVEAAQKKGFEHFMLKEMLEIPDVLENALRGRIDDSSQVHLGGLIDVTDRLASVKRVIMTGCGSAYYAGLVGELLIEELAGIPVEVEVASEFRYRRFVADPETTVLIAVSQSGETADTLEAVRLARNHGMLTLGIVNAVGSSIARETDGGVYNHAGPEIGVASTKAFLSQLAVCALVALFLKQVRGGGVSPDVVRDLRSLPRLAQEVLDARTHIEAIAKKYAGAKDALFIGRKFQFPIAYEGALKLKEVSYIHAEAYGAGEMKHGPLALIEEGFPTIALVPRDSVYEKTLSNIEEIRARGGKIIAVSTERELAAADDLITVPLVHEALLPLLTAIPLQLLAYYAARERGLPIDMPRNLAKSVTVE